MTKSTVPTITLNNDVEIPSLGLGTYRALGDASVRAVKFALNHSYALIDTAQAYDNEGQVGGRLESQWKIKSRSLYHHQNPQRKSGTQKHP